MHKKLKESFSRRHPAGPSVGLFDKIILAIQREQELRRTRRLLLGFLFPLVVSFVSIPLSWNILINQIRDSGISYFVSAAVSDFGTSLLLWKEFGLAIFESLPLAGILVFAASLAISIFTLRLFLHRKRLLIGYLTNNFA